MELGRRIRMCKKPLQRREKVFKARNNTHRLKTNPAMFLMKKKNQEAAAGAKKNEAVKERGDTI